MGRPSKYKVEYNEQVEKLAKLGATDKDLANFFNVIEQTINNWKKEHKNGFQKMRSLLKRQMEPGQQSCSRILDNVILIVCY